MANVTLSNEESAVIQNAAFLLTKNIAIDKLQKAFGRIALQYQNITKESNAHWQPHTQIQPKISKGEQYEGLPYLMLDYPRVFTQTDTLAIRSFFWWGNYFSISLLLTGESQKVLAAQLWANPLLRDWHIDLSDSPWNHKWEMTESTQLSALPKQKLIEKDFFKISKQIPLSQWQDMESFFIRNFQQLWSAISCLDV